MKNIHVAMVALAGALLLSGCYGYGPHMGWGDRGGHMGGEHRNGYRGDGYPPAPCDQDPRSREDLPPCRPGP